MTEDLKYKIEVLKRMDKAMRCLNDEEHPALWEWLEQGIPDGSSEEDLADYITTDPEWYGDMCILFADLISRIITKGEINEKGFLIEFWRGK